ncbi:MAG: hypothetical protein ACREBR_05180 [bacterium]
MKVLDMLQAARAIAKAKKKPVLFLSLHNEGVEYNEIIKAAPYLDIESAMQSLGDGYAIIVCETDKERDTLYNLTVGDDGPTKVNKYKGPARVYALTIDRRGQTLNENT